MLIELRRIALFEFIPYESVTDKLKAMIPEDEDSFEEESIIDEMGAMLVIGVALFIVILLTLLLGRMCKSTACLKIVAKIKQKLLWNSVIRYSL